MQALYEADVNAGALDQRRLVIVGYGAQGRPQALNLRDSGLHVTIAARPGGASHTQASADGFRVLDVPTAVAQADVLQLLIPDEVQPEVYAQDVRPRLRSGAYVGFAHGFCVHFNKIDPAADINVFLVAPKGVGRMVRRQYEAGSGVPCLVAVQQDPAGDTRDVAHAYACALGGGRAGILETSFREETETDLFGEQTVLCGGMVELIRAAFETLVEAGYEPEMAYFECLHEVKLIADLVHERGIADMRRAISNTAEFGGLTRGPRVVTPAVRAAMKEILAEIRSGRFADEWLAEHADGQPRLKAAEAEEAGHAIETVGRKLRDMMPWLRSAD